MATLEAVEANAPVPFLEDRLPFNTVAFSGWGEEEDPFGAKIRNAVAEIEAAVTPRLRP